MPPPEPEEPRPKPKPPKHKPKPPKPDPEKDQTAPDGVPLPPERSSCATDCSASCAFYHLCPVAPPSPSSGDAATLHLRSPRLPTPLVALSASLLAVSVVLLIALLVCSLVRRRMRRRRRQTAPQEAPLTQQDEEGAPVPAVVAEEGEDGGVHHVWYIRTVGLEERTIAAITALVYDAKKCGGGVGGDGGSCAVCLAEFRDGETLRLLPRCHHAFHRGCIDTWLRAHVNCPLCREPVQVADKTSAAAGANAVPAAATTAPGGQPEANPRATGAPETERGEAQGLPERGVRRAASMVALPRRAWPDVSLREPVSNSSRVGEIGLAKIARLMKLSEVLEMAGIGAGRSLSFRSANCLHLPGRSGPSAAGTNADEISR
ncbi:hypothetical protein ABZP36_009996 [Zizania latifolia]